MDCLVAVVEGFVSRLIHTSSFRSCFPIAKDVDLNGKRLQVLRLLGEGGYSYVYLVRDASAKESKLYALKRIWAATPEQLEAAKYEISVVKRLHHENLLQMLDSSIVPKTDDSGITGSEIFILFPAFSDGSLLDEVDRRQVAHNPFTPSQILDIFLQICQAVAAMHSASPALAHRDIKPQNVLVCASGKDRNEETIYQVALTDFGSTRLAVQEITCRADALRLQEDAEANCSAPYRAPELFDVPSQCVVDGRVDVWSLGCVLFFMMYGESPFERALGEAGGSLALAVMNGKIAWPKSPQRAFPEELNSVVLMCLETNPAVRPHVHAVITELQRIKQGWAAA